MKTVQVEIRIPVEVHLVKKGDTVEISRGRFVSEETWSFFVGSLRDQKKTHRVPGALYEKRSKETRAFGDVIKEFIKSERIQMEFPVRVFQRGSWGDGPVPTLVVLPPGLTLKAEDIVAEYTF